MENECSIFCMCYIKYIGVFILGNKCPPVLGTYRWGGVFSSLKVIPITYGVGSYGSETNASVAQAIALPV